MDDLPTNVNTNEMAAIDARIATLERELHFLRKRRNEFPAIRRLPTEIVVNIFKLLIPSIPDDGDDTDEEHQYQIDPLREIFKFQPENPDDGCEWTFDLSWVRFMSVCTWLRQIAMQSPILWHLEGIKIPGNSEWIELCRNRAERTSPLLYCQTDMNVGADAFGRRESEINHTLSLLNSFITESIEAFISFIPANGNGESEVEDELIDTALTSLSQVCPSLRYLNIAWSKFSVDENFLGGVAANLTTLVLAYVDDLSGIGPQCPTLRNLKIQFSIWPRNVNMLTLLAWLAILTTLEVLSIESHSAFVPPRSINQPTPAPIHLPHLRILRLSLRVQETLRILCALPEPRIGLDVKLMDHPVILEQDDFTGKATSGQAFETIIQMFTQFWHKDNPITSLNALGVTIMCPTYINRHNPYVQLAVRSFPRGILPDVTRRFCNLIGPYHGHAPLATRVKDLHLDSSFGFGGYEFFSTYTEMMLERMDLHTVIWGQSNFKHDHVLQLGTWLTQRKESGKPVRLLQIGKLATEEGLGWFQELVPNLLDSRIVDNVEWL